MTASTVDGNAVSLPEACSLLTDAPVAAFVTRAGGEDAQGRVLGPVIAFANPALLVLTGHVGDALVGHPLDLLRSRRGDHAAWIAFCEALAAGRGARGELLFARAGGDTFTGAVHVVPAADGGAAGQVGWIVDVTRRVDAEGALLLSQQREALGLLTNSVAHEFNNFLQILIGYVDGLKRRLADRPEPFIQRAVTRSTEAAERAAVLTRQLLAHSRRIAPDLRPTDLDAHIADVAHRLRAGLPAAVNLAVAGTPGLAPALCNTTQVELALRHIVANAVEALGGEGGVEIATFAVPPGDRSLQRPGDGAVGLAITDRGHGMSPEMLTRALAPFATSREAGRGVGLAIVHGLMKRQNGTISLESRPGEGTTVRLVFPAAPAPRAEETEPAEGGHAGRD